MTQNRRMRVGKINMILKLVINVTNRLIIYADAMIQFGLYNSNCFSLKKGCLGVFRFYNPNKVRNTPYFLRFSDYKIRIGEKLFFFHPITMEKLNSDSKIRKPHGHFHKKHRAHEKVIGWKSKGLYKKTVVGLKFVGAILYVLQYTPP